MLPAWIIDTANSTFMGYNPTNGVLTGVDHRVPALLSTGTPGLGQIEYSNASNAAAFTTGLSAGTAIVDVFTTATALGTTRTFTPCAATRTSARAAATALTAAPPRWDRPP